MPSKTRLVLILSLLFSLATAGTAAAQAPAPEPCQGDSVSGVVVAVDEVNGVVTIETSDGLCTVGLNGDHPHPIVALLGAYFDDLSADELADALETLMVRFTCDPATSQCALVSDDDPGTEAKVMAVTDNGDGTFTLELLVVDDAGNEETIFITTDNPLLAGELTDAMQMLAVDWQLKLDQDGNVLVVEAGDEIAALHDDGMGFGVIVKLYAMAQDSQEACASSTPPDPTSAVSPDNGTACGVTVDELVAAFQSGAGMGQLFKQYGKPSLLGVGHVRHADKDNGNGKPDHAASGNHGNGNGGNKGICNARSRGGNAKAKGKGNVTCTQPPGS